MALPASGAIKMSQVKTETALSSNSIRAYGAYFNLSAPDSMTEFLGLTGTGYSVSPNVSSVNEGSSVTWTITTTNIPNGTTLYWTNSGTTNGSDFSDSLNSGTITISGNSGSFSKTLTNDVATEGTETIIIQIRTGSTSGTVVATSSAVSVNDTSLAPTYSISPNVSSVNEGSSVTWTITTTNVANGTTLYWTNSGAATTGASDFTDNLNSGNVTISGNSATFSKTLANDLSTNEGSETIIMQLRTSSTSGTIVATSSTVTVNDTSKAPTYAISPNNTSVNETDNKIVEWTITTTDVSNGTTLYWTNEGTTTGSDFTDGSNSGYVTISNNSATFSKTLIPDYTSEGSETIIIYLRTISTSGTVVATSATVTVSDTSVCPPDGTFINDFCGGTNNWNYYWTVANGSCGTRNELKEAYSETHCNYVRLSATYSIGFDSDGNGVIYVESMSNGTGGNRRFSVNNGVTWYDYPAFNSVGGLTPGGTYTLIVTDDSGKGTNYTGLTMPTFSISPNKTNINEGDSVTWTVTTTGVGSATLYYSNNGSTNGSDFTDNANNGSVGISSNSGNFSKTLRNDVSTEGGENIIMLLRIGSTGGTVVATASTVTVNDTSKNPTYSIYPSTTSVNEGNSVTWTIDTTDVGDGTILYATNSGTTNGSDFTDGSNQAQITINSNTGNFSKTIINDSSTEGQETIIMDLRINSYNGTSVATANTVYVNDTSVCPTAGTLLNTFCSGINNWDLYGTYADGSCGTYNSLIEAYNTSCGYVKVSATYSTTTGGIYNIVMSNGIGTGRKFSVDNGNTWYDYPTNNSVYGLPSGQQTVLIITDDSNKGTVYFVYIP